MNYTHETTLKPHETEMHVEAWITEADNLTEPNRYGEYEFSFVPLQQHDSARIKEIVMTSLRQVDYSHPEANAIDKTETPKGEYKVSQLFSPKLNKQINHPMEILHKHVFLKLHLRDDVGGRVWLQADYVDMYEDAEPVRDEPQAALLSAAPKVSTGSTTTEEVPGTT